MGSEGVKGATVKPLEINMKDKKQLTPNYGCPKGSKGRSESPLEVTSKTRNRQPH